MRMPLRVLTALLAAATAVATAVHPDPAKDLWGGKRTFAARLSADNQPVVTDSAGTGAVRIVLDIGSDTIRWEITHADLTSPPIVVGLHGPAQPGTNGAQLINLGGKSLESPIRGSARISAGQIQYMLLGWTYVLISTRRYPEGEIRGKVDLVPPERAED